MILAEGSGESRTTQNGVMIGTGTMLLVPHVEKHVTGMTPMLGPTVRGIASEVQQNFVTRPVERKDIS